MYTMYMALHINNPMVEQKVRDLAGVTGESITDAIGSAVTEVLERLRPRKNTKAKPSFEEFKALISSYNLHPINNNLSDDEILGYGPDGIPE